MQELLKSWWFYAVLGIGFVIVCAVHGPAPDASAAAIEQTRRIEAREHPTPVVTLPVETEAAKQERLSWAFWMSTVFVKRQLLAPSTAQFPSFGDAEVTVVDEGGDRYHVNGYVDAENGFGAHVRSTYRCQLHKEAGDNWRVDSLKVE